MNISKDQDHFFGDPVGLKTRLLDEMNDLPVAGRYSRGLYCGGTLAYEATNILVDSVNLSTNFPYPRTNVATNPLKPIGNAIIDFGADEFTRGRVHPMIDPDIRNRMVDKSIKDPNVALTVF